MTRRGTSFGFTLLEVLVALAVLAIAMGALIRIAAQSADNLAYLRDRTLASWVATNKINEWLLAPSWPPLGVREGTATLAGRDWHWRLTVSRTDDADMRRLDVAVASAEERPALLELVAFRGRP